MADRMTLTEFLLARIAEDEAAAREATPGPWSIDPREYPDAQHIGRHDPPRVLAQCEALPGVIGLAWRYEETIEGEYGSGRSREQLEAAGVAPDLLCHLATIWADHPDYRPEWKP